MGGVIDDFRIDHEAAARYHKKTSSFEKIKEYITKEEENFSNERII